MKVAIADLYAQSGKTTLALNLGAALAKRGASVLVVDVDPRGQLDGLEGLSDSGTVLDRRSIQMLRATSLQGLQVVTGTGRWLTQASTPPSDLGTLQAWFPKFDWVLFDTSAQNRPAMEYSIGLSDYVLSPLPMEAEAFRHTPDFLRLLTTAQVAQPTLIFGGFVPYHRQPAIAAGEQATARETLTVMSHEFPQVAW